MSRYRTHGENDDQPAMVGDNAFLGVDEYNAQENIRPGNVHRAVNLDFSSQDASTRGGFVCLPELGTQPFGMTWTSRTPATATRWDAVAYGAGLYVAVSTSGTGNRVMTSPDGITWTSRTSAADYNWSDITFGNGLFVAVATSGTTDRIMTSPDGITWTLRTSPNNPLRGVTYGNGKFVAVGTSGTIATSSDGITWSTETPVANTLSCVAYGNGLFVACALSVGAVYYSTDGSSWTLVSDANFPLWADITYGAGVFVGVGTYAGLGRVWTSPDGATWTERDATSTNVWTHVAYGGGLFVAVANNGSSGQVMTSGNGINWLQRESASISAWEGVCYGNGRFVAVADSVVMTSDATFVFASGVYSDPDEAGSQWIMLLGQANVGFYQFGETSRSVSLGGYTISELSTIVQCNNQVYVFRGSSSKPLYWDGNWSSTFLEVPDTSLPSSFNSIPYSNQATYHQNRLWVKDGKDEIAASDILEFTDYDPFANEFNLNTGNSNYVVTTFPFGQNSLVVFKNKSVMLLQNVEGSLLDVTVTEITRQVGATGINAVASIGPDLAYVSYGNINLLTLTSTNNSVQHKTLPLSTKIQSIMRRVNWSVSHKISLGYWNNKLYVALPLDNATSCNTVVVYNFTTENWYGEWSFSDSINMQILGWVVNDYLGLQRLHAITEDGRIFVTDEGSYDISGSTVANISTELVTRAYDSSNVNHTQRRLQLDLATNRPKFSVSVFTEGVSEESVVLTDQTYSRSESWKFNDSTYDLTNANNDFNRAYRKDYSSGPDSIQSGTGFMPELAQEFRMPIITRRQGRLSWLKVSNTQGFISIMSVGLEVRQGQRSNLIQV